MNSFTLKDFAVVPVNGPSLDGVVQGKTVDKFIMRPVNSTLRVPFTLIIPGK
jgi:hypothetical protein